MTLKKKFFGKLAVLFFVFFALMLLIPLQASAEGEAEPESRGAGEQEFGVRSSYVNGV